MESRRQGADDAPPRRREAARAAARYINRELSWLDFDWRVLALAQSPQLPLLERVKFLAIATNNLDEFFQVRVAGLQDQAAAGVRVRTPDGRNAVEQLREIRTRVLELTHATEALFRTDLAPALAAAGIELCSYDSLGAGDREFLRKRFDAQIFPVLTPLAVDPAHPFPYISNLSLNLAVLARHPDGHQSFARVKVPPFLPRLLALPDGRRFVWIEQVIGAHLDALFPATEVTAWGAFRVTRDADLELREKKGGDLREAIETSLRRRHRGSDAVRLEIASTLSDAARRLLVEELELESSDVYAVDGPLNLGALSMLTRLDRPELKQALWEPQRVASFEPLAGSDEPIDLFARLREHDVLVHHPYESFESSVEAFLSQAASDPAVRAIKHTLYRTGGPEPGILRSLQRAAAAGKQVVVLVELKARFDEEANIERARALEQSGVHVVYGLVGLKTHAKIALVVRQEPAGIQRYCHVGTGNYNPVTARLYEDLGLFSASPEIGSEVADLFNHLTSASGKPQCEKLWVAPHRLRSEVLTRIREEMGAPDGRIVIKVNGLSDPEIIEALYEASEAGVEIDLIVRGICCLRAGVPGMSTRIRVRSILGRFLEHSRIYRFGSAARGVRYLIGSADLMQRNLDFRVEALVPVEDPDLQARLEEILALCVRPDASAWELGPEGKWLPTGGSLDVQAMLQQLARERAAREWPGLPPTSPRGNS